MCGINDFGHEQPRFLEEKALGISVGSLLSVRLGTTAVSETTHLKLVWGAESMLSVWNNHSFEGKVHVIDVGKFPSVKEHARYCGDSCLELVCDYCFRPGTTAFVLQKIVGIRMR